MASPSGYKQLNTVKNLKAVQEAKLNGNKAAARLYSCSPSSIRLWKTQEESLKKLVGDNYGFKKTTGNPGRSIKWPELDTMLPLWIDGQRKNHKRVTLKAIKKQALQILGDLGVNATPEDIPKGWISRMCKRNGFSQRRKSTAN